jgi:hypothetical protein
MDKCEKPEMHNYWTRKNPPWQCPACRALEDRKPQLTQIRFDSDFIINGEFVKAGTVWRFQ